MMSPQRRRKIIVVVALAMAAIVISIYAIFDPSSGFFPACPIKFLTGLDCPGCGSQRAFHALLHGDIEAAWHFNALIFLLTPVAALITVAELTREKHPRFHRAMTSPAIIATIIALIILWTIVRNQ